MKGEEFAVERVGVKEEDASIEAGELDGVAAVLSGGARAGDEELRIDGFIEAHGDGVEAPVEVIAQDHFGEDAAFLVRAARHGEDASRAGVEVSGVDEPETDGRKVAAGDEEAPDAAAGVMDRASDGWREERGGIGGVRIADAARAGEVVEPAQEFGAPGFAEMDDLSVVDVSHGGFRLGGCRLCSARCGCLKRIGRTGGSRDLEGRGCGPYGAAAKVCGVSAGVLWSGEGR